MINEINWYWLLNKEKTLLKIEKMAAVADPDLTWHHAPPLGTLP